MPEMTQNPPKAKHRKKNRESHNEVERHRKKKINSGINRIGDLIPCSPALKQSKNMILDQAFKYITELKRQNDELLLNGGDQEQAIEIVRLRKDLAETQKENARYIELLKSNDICLYDDPTLYWKGNHKNSKASLVVPADQVQKPLCLSGNQLGSNNSTAAVQGITFNVGNNLQKQTANVVPVQRTCNIVTPITISGVSLLEGKTWQQSATTITSSSQQASLCLPLATPAPITVGIATSKVERSVLIPISSASHPLLNSAASQIQFASTQTSLLGENRVQSSEGATHPDNLPKVSSSISSSLPSNLSSLVPEVPLVSVSGISLQESPNLLQGQLSGAASCAVKDVIQEIFPSISTDSGLHIANSSREVVTTAVETAAGCAVSSGSASSLGNSWSLSAVPTRDLKSIGSLARVPSDGNTQTTWTTLQIAGSTIQPLSQAPPSVVPMLVTEQRLCPKEVIANKPTPCINLSSLTSDTGKPVEQVMVKMSSCQPVQMQSRISQPHSATNILPLNQPLQVIQVAQPVAPAVNPAQANQNIIFLQPPTPAPCTPVIQAEVPKPTIGQQIVIIQAAPNQNPLPLMPTQPTPPVVVPLNPANPVVCPSNSVQSTSPPQIFGGKHLVHILPRPATLVAPSTTQSAPSSTASANQQPPTISLNGQLFALQPVTPSAGTSSQTHMQIIQPTTCEDPNTNVALNTFGALANLSQSISQIAGQSCLQFTVNSSAAAVTSANIPLNCVSTSGVSTTTESPPVTSTPTNAACAKPPGGSPSSKAKKGIKKTNVKKSASSRKEDIPSNKSNKPESTCVQSSKLPSAGEVQKLQDNACMVTSVQGNSNVSDISLCNGSSTESVQESNTLIVLNTGVEERLIPKPVEPYSSEFSSTRDHGSGADTCITQLPDSSLPESIKSLAATNISAKPACRQPMHNTTIRECTTQSGVSAAGPSQVFIGSDACVTEINSAALTATDLLEAQILSDDPKGKSLSVVESTKEVVGDELIYRKEKSKESDEHVKQDVSLLPIAASSVSQHQSGTTEQEMEICSSVPNSRQTDSPMSTSSSSSRNFSVASMLPDASREDVTNNTPPVTEFTGCSFAEQSDIVAVAARAIFDQVNLAKGRPRQQLETPAPVSNNTNATLLTAECRNPYTPQAEKESFIQLPAKSTSFTSHNTNAIPSADRMEEKNNCPVGINTTNLSLQIPSSQSQNVTSLSINNLIQHGGTTHSIANFANAPQTSTQVTLPPASKPVLSSGNYESQGHRSATLSEYSQEQLHSMRSTVMQVTHTTESLLKQTDEHRKDSNKRSAHEDGLLSTAKRQKQCQVPLRLERIQAPDGLGGQNEIMVSHVPSNTSSSVSGGNTVHEDGLGPLFPSSNSFVRQSDLRCSSQTSVSEHQQGQMASQHLMQQHTPNHQGSLHHSSVPYLKQQQQAGHLREQHHLYQQQQHHVPHAESSVHAQSRSVQQQQQRLIQQDVQMQKKQTPVQSSQPTRMSLQQKQHLAEQNRSKGAQTHQSHHQQIQQQMQSHFGPSQADKTCENTAPNRSHHGTHPQSHVSQDILHQHPQEVGSRTQGPPVSSEHLLGHSQVQRLMTSRSLEQQLVSQPSIISRPTNMACTTHRQERNRVSSYSAEALIGKTTSNSEQRMGLSIQGSRVSEQLEMRKYLDISRNKGLAVHNIHGQISIEHSVNTDAQRLPDCQTFKAGGSSQQQRGSFDAQTSRPNDVNTVSSMRGMQSQAYKITQNQNLSMDQQKHLSYQLRPDLPLSNTLPIRDNENSCHQSFMQSLLAPHIGEQVGVGQRLISSNQRNTQYNPASGGVEYSCPTSRDAVHLRRDVDGQNRESCDLAIAQVTSRSHSLNIPFSSSTSSVEIPSRSISPNASMQKANMMRPNEAQGAKNHLNIQVSINMHGVVHPAIPQHSVSHSNLDQRQNVRQQNPPVSQRSRHLLLDNPDSKGRQPERNRPGNQRHSNMFEPALPHLSLTGPSSMILGRQQPVNDKRPGIVRFMPDNTQVSSDNPAPDQHSLTQNFGFPFIPEGTMNPPINANASFIPPVTQAASTRTPALIQVDPPNTLPSFYPPYSPAHPSLSNDITIPYFPNQMFPNPSTEKPNSTGLNNRFGTILSPPRPVGFSQTTFPLLPDMPPMHIANPSHLSNFNLTSLFPEIATTLPTDGSAMSPLLSISHSSGSDSSKQSSNRPAHNISHILGHDSSSAV